MKTVPYTNNTEKTVHIGGATILAGETRDVDPSLLPDWNPDPVHGLDISASGLGTNDASDLASLLKSNVKTVIDALSNLTTEQLAEATALEQAGLARKSLLEALSAETLKRAAE